MLVVNNGTVQDHSTQAVREYIRVVRNRLEMEVARHGQDAVLRRSYWELQRSISREELARTWPLADVDAALADAPEWTDWTATGTMPLRYRRRYEPPLGRLAFLAALALVVLLLLAGRLWTVQVVAADRYQRLAEQNRVREVLIEAPRGNIFDRHGQPLARTRHPPPAGS
jgi:hypothetical protein